MFITEQQQQQQKGWFRNNQGEEKIYQPAGVQK